MRPKSGRGFFRILSGDSRGDKVKRNIIESFLIKGVSIVVSLALVPITIGYVSPELYGVWLTLSSVMMWVQFLDIGFTQGLKNKLAEAVALGQIEKGKSLVSTTYFMMALIFVPLCVVLEFLIPIVNWTGLLNVDIVYSLEIQKALSVLVVFVCMQMIVNVIVSVVSAFQEVALSNLFAVVGQILSLVAIVILTKVCPPSLVSLSFAFAALPVLVTIIGSVILFSKQYNNVSPSISCIDRNQIKDLFGLGYKFFIINVQVVVLYQTTNILISHLSSPIEVTYYNVAYKYLNMAMMAYTIITAPLWPAYTDAYTKKDYTWMKNTRSRMTKVMFLSFFVCSLMMLVSQPVYRLWLNGEVNVPIVMTILVGLYVMVYCWMNLNGTIIVGIGAVKIETVAVLIGMIVHIPLSFLLGRFIGGYGVIVSMILINVAYAVLFNVQANKILSLKAKGIWLS